MPKQFARLVDAQTSPFQAPLARVSDASVFASAEARFIVAEQRDQLGLSADILLEPQERSSAAAVTLIMAATHAFVDAA